MTCVTRCRSSVRKCNMNDTSVKLNHRRFRALLKKLRRKRIRQKAAQERDRLLKVDGEQEEEPAADPAWEEQERERAATVGEAAAAAAAEQGGHERLHTKGWPATSLLWLLRADHGSEFSCSATAVGTSDGCHSLKGSVSTSSGWSGKRRHSASLPAAARSRLQPTIRKKSPRRTA